MVEEGESSRSIEDRNEHDSSVPLQHFAADARGLRPHEFESVHGWGFLVRSLADGMFESAPPLSSPEWRKNTRQLALRHDRTPATGEAVPQLFYAYSLPFARRSVLRVGRAHTCEVCISEVSVSMFHAELELDDQRRVVLTDRGSTNGSWVGRDPVGFGQSATVDFGKTIRFGNVKLTFMPVQPFIDFVKLVTDEPRLEIE